MAFVAVRASVACLAWLAAVAGGAAQTVSSGPAIVIDIGKAPRIPNPPMPPIYIEMPDPNRSRRDATAGKQAEAAREPRSRVKRGPSPPSRRAAWLLPPVLRRRRSSPSSSIARPSSIGVGTLFGGLFVSDRTFAGASSF